MLAHTYSKEKKMVITKEGIFFFSFLSFFLRKEGILNEIFMLLKIAPKHIPKKKKKR